MIDFMKPTSIMLHTPNILKRGLFPKQQGLKNTGKLEFQVNSQGFYPLCAYANQGLSEQKFRGFSMGLSTWRKPVRGKEPVGVASCKQGITPTGRIDSKPFERLKAYF